MSMYSFSNLMKTLCSDEPVIVSDAKSFFMKDFFPLVIDGLSIGGNLNCLSEDDKAVFADKNVILSLLNHNINYFKIASVELRNDKEVVMLCLSKDKDLNLINYVGREVRGDLDVARLILKNSGSLYAPSYYGIPDSVFENKDFVIDAIKIHPGYIVYASNDLANTKDVVDAFIESANLFSKDINPVISPGVNRSYPNNKDISFALMKLDCRNYRYLCDDMKADKDIVAMTLDCPAMYPFIPSTMFGNKDICLKILGNIKSFNEALPFVRTPFVQLAGRDIINRFDKSMLIDKDVIKLMFSKYDIRDLVPLYSEDCIKKLILSGADSIDIDVLSSISEAPEQPEDDDDFK